ncbi:MAG TPA: ABC transporter substrate-binding protein [Chloroflexota bacterium]|jgi:NitT/TauT family transport system substrate-binding protein|nr:ABC transporter substrate-binding protein [Chloroflexota bacterium]
MRSLSVAAGVALALALVGCMPPAAAPAPREPAPLAVTSAPASTSSPAADASAVPEKRQIVIGVGGQELFVYLPLTLAQQLGLFEEAGLRVEILNFQGGARALEALVAGSADLVSGFFDHTIQKQTTDVVPLTMVVLFDRYPGVVLLAEPALASQLRDLRDLKGKTLGVTSLGSSSHMLLNYVLAQAGLGRDDVGVLSIGTGASALAALESGRVPAGMFLDPTATQLQQLGKARVLWDTRSERDTTAALGGPYPAGGLYTVRAYIETYPRTVQAAVTASVRALRWIQQHSAAEIADRMPESFYGGDKRLYVDSLQASLPMFSPDGLMPEGGPARVLEVLRLSDEAVRNAAHIDLAATYTNRFAEAVR